MTNGGPNNATLFYVAVMRPLTSGILQRILRFLKRDWSSVDVYAVALQFVLSDSRVHVANVGMRWPNEVDTNVDLVEGFHPPTDFADLPRLTAGIYRLEDEDADQRYGAAPASRVQHHNLGKERGLWNGMLSAD